MRKLILLSLCILTVLNISCATDGVVVPNTEACTVAGVIAAGAICAETITGKTRDMSMDEFFDFLEPREEQPDPTNPGHTLSSRGGAICQSVDDWNSQKTALEIACRILGKNCTYEIKQAIEGMNAVSMLNEKQLEKRQMLK
jgi:hypothetical protein